MKKLILYVSCMAILTSCKVNSFNDEDHMYFLDIDDYELSGKLPSSDEFHFPRLMFTESSNDFKMITVFLSEKYQRDIVFQRKSNYWLREEEYTESGIEFVHEEYVFKNVIYNVSFEKETKRLAAISKWSEHEMYIDHSFSEDYKFPPIGEIDAFLKRDLNCFIDRDYYSADFEKITSGKRRFNNKGSLIVEQEYCYELKSFRSLLLFNLYSQYLKRLQC
jgi:hypothetical protein